MGGFVKKETLIYLLCLCLMAIPSSGYGAQGAIGGYIKEKTWIFKPGTRGLTSLVDNSSGIEENLDIRLKHRLYLTSHISMELHYEWIYLYSERIKRINKLKTMFPVPEILSSSRLDRDTHFMDLTSKVEKGSTLSLHTLDRLNITFTYSSLTITLGRQAISWGYGFLFTPADIINPFPPDAIDREYKPGEDMMDMEVNISEDSRLEFLFVPRREPDTGNFAWDDSSLGARFQFSSSIDFYSFILKHYKDIMLALGMEGYISGAAWRMDMVETFIDSQMENRSFSIGGNLDYSWVWWSKNFHGFMEFFYKELGSSNYGKALLDPSIGERIKRGELYLLGRTYLGGGLQIEIHPLVHGFTNLILNAHDPSGLFQTYLTWEVLQDLEITGGITLPFGREGTEFGGYSIPPGILSTEPDRLLYLWVEKYY